MSVRWSTDPNGCRPFDALDGWAPCVEGARSLSQAAVAEKNRRVSPWQHSSFNIRQLVSKHLKHGRERSWPQIRWNAYHRGFDSPAKGMAAAQGLHSIEASDKPFHTT